MIPAPVKRCTRCGVLKPFEAFSARKASRDGLQPRCKQCQDAIGTEKRDALKKYEPPELEGEASVSEVAATLKITPQRVRQIEATALRKLRQRAKRMGLR